LRNGSNGCTKDVSQYKELLGSPPGNGRAELAVPIRKCLLEAQLGADHWPLPLRHINEVSRWSRLGKTPTWPQFWKEVVNQKEKMEERRV